MCNRQGDQAQAGADSQRLFDTAWPACQSSIYSPLSTGLHDARTHTQQYKYRKIHTQHARARAHTHTSSKHCPVRTKLISNHVKTFVWTRCWKLSTTVSEGICTDKHTHTTKYGGGWRVCGRGSLARNSYLVAVFLSLSLFLPFCLSRTHCSLSVAAPSSLSLCHIKLSLAASYLLSLCVSLCLSQHTHTQNARARAHTHTHTRTHIHTPSNREKGSGKK